MVGNAVPPLLARSVALAIARSAPAGSSEKGKARVGRSGTPSNEVSTDAIGIALIAGS